MPDMTEFSGVRAVSVMAAVAMIAGVTFLSQTGFRANAGSTPLSVDPIVVVDPGHGGPDPGASGDNGLLEKNVVLALSEALGSMLGRGYQARLTRTGDYHVDIQRRTGIANHLEAGVFVSIHAGDSYLRQTRGATVYYYGGGRQVESPIGDLEHLQGNAIQWEKVQERHQDKSKQLAEIIKKHIDGLPSATEKNCRVISAPMVILAGADMPAVLIEIGYLRNPQDSKQLVGDREIGATAAAISDAIVEFFYRQQS